MCVYVFGKVFSTKKVLDNLNNITHYYIEADSEASSPMCFQLMTCCAVIVQPVSWSSGRRKMSACWMKPSCNLGNNSNKQPADVSLIWTIQSCWRSRKVCGFSRDWLEKIWARRTGWRSSRSSSEHGPFNSKKNWSEPNNSYNKKVRSLAEWQLLISEPYQFSVTFGPSLECLAWFFLKLHYGCESIKTDLLNRFLAPNITVL